MPAICAAGPFERFARHGGAADRMSRWVLHKAMASWPRTYQLVRHGRPATVAAAGPEDLWPIRMGLELVLRLGASCDDGLADRLRVMLRRLLTAGQPEDGRACRRLTECLGILADARATANRAAIAEIDAEFPGLLTSTDMSEIEKEQRRFEQELAELSAAGDAEDVDAILAALEQAEKKPDAGPGPGVATPGDGDVDIDALLAEEVSAPAAPQDEPSLEGSLDDIEEALTRAGEILSEEEAGRILAEDSGILSAESPVDDSVDQARAAADACAPTDSAFEPAGNAAEEVIQAGDAGGRCACDAPTEAAQASPTDDAELLADSIVGDDAELEAIASAFEQAASELDGLNTQVQQMASGPDAGFDPTAESPFLDDEPLDTAADSTLPDTPAVTGPVGQAPAPGHKTVPVRPVGDAAADSGSCPTRPLRDELEAIRGGILGDLDRVAALLNTIDRTRQAAEEAYARAKAFRDVAAEGVQAAEAMANAQLEASTAREAYERALQRLQEARRAWEQVRARTAAAEQAAADLHPGQSGPAR